MQTCTAWYLSVLLGLLLWLNDAYCICIGQIILPPNYLPEVYKHVQGAGGLCIADEVQVCQKNQ